MECQGLGSRALGLRVSGFRVWGLGFECLSVFRVFRALSVLSF